MKIEIITTKTKLTKSIIQQMHIASSEEMKLAIERPDIHILGHINNIKHPRFKNNSMIYLCYINNQYLVIPNRDDRCVSSRFNKIHKEFLSKRATKIQIYV